MKKKIYSTTAKSKEKSQIVNKSSVYKYKKQFGGNYDKIYCKV